MTQKEFIVVHAKEHNWDSSKVRELHIKYCNENNVPCDFSSFARRFRELKAERKVEIPDKPKTIEQKISDFNVKDEMSILRSENKLLLDKLVDVERIIQACEKAVQVYQPFSAPEFKSIPKGNREALLSIGDIHYGEIVSSADTMGIGGYNMSIAKKRLEQVFALAIDSANELGVDVLNIALIGDMIDGIIQHDSLLGMETGVVESIIQIADYIAQLIREASKQFPTIKVVCVPGNHGRILYAGKPNNKKYVEFNFDTLVYNFVKKELAAIVPDFQIPKSIFTIMPIMDTKVFVTHGHIFGGGGNGYSVVPNNIGKNMAKLNSLVGKIGKNVDFSICGHFHVAIETLSFDLIPVYISGSLVGGDEYSINQLCRSSKPSQGFWAIEKGIGIKYHSNLTVD